MPAPLRLDPAASFLTALAGLLAILGPSGCGYYRCEDGLKERYTPHGRSDVGVPAARWLDDRTLELRFAHGLSPTTQADPSRFTLLRYTADFTSGAYGYCYFDICYETIPELTKSIPVSADWDPADPDILQLQFSDPIPRSACAPRGSAKIDFQALSLAYEGASWSAYDGEEEQVPGALYWPDISPVESFGKGQCLSSVCEFGWDGCDLQGGYDYDSSSERPSLWIPCPD